MLAETFLDLAGWFNNLDIPNCLIGGLAVGAHGIPRGTEDVDFLVSKEKIEAKKQELAAVVETRNGRIEYRKTKFEDRMRDLRVIVLPDRPRVDLLHTRYVYEENFIKRAIPETFRGQSYRLIRSDDLIILKLRALRPHDLYDIAALLRNNDVDPPYLSDAIKKARLEKEWATFQRVMNGADDASVHQALQNKKGEQVFRRLEE